MNATIVKKAQASRSPVQDPLNKTIHDAIRKERKRKAERMPRASGQFNPISMEALMAGRQIIEASHKCAKCERSFETLDGLATHTRMKHGSEAP